MFRCKPTSTENTKNISRKDASSLKNQIIWVNKPKIAFGENRLQMEPSILLPHFHDLSRRPEAELLQRFTIRTVEDRDAVDRFHDYFSDWIELARQQVLEQREIVPKMNIIGPDEQVDALPKTL
jgi:hypothetical protein